MNPILNFVEKGNSGNRPIVFIHGFMGSSMDFDKIMSQLSNNFHCIAVDLPGHGMSGFKSKQQLNKLSNFLSIPELLFNDIKCIGINRFSLYGYSMGGRIAQGIKILHPESVDCLILESSSFGIFDKGERNSRYKKDIELLDDIKTDDNFRKFLENWYSLPLFNTLHGTKELKSLINKKIKNSVEELKKAIKIMSVGNQPYFIDELLNYNSDINYIYGEKDDKYKEIAFNAKKEIPAMKLFPFNGASHNVHMQYGDRIVEVVRDILLPSISHL